MENIERPGFQYVQLRLIIRQTAKEPRDRLLPALEQVPHPQTGASQRRQERSPDLLSCELRHDRPQFEIMMWAQGVPGSMSHGSPPEGRPGSPVPSGVAPGIYTAVSRRSPSGSDSTPGSGRESAVSE